jgi:putative AlgH/UPF0301 family transcriptional regulator
MVADGRPSVGLALLALATCAAAHRLGYAPGGAVLRPACARRAAAVVCRGKKDIWAREDASPIRAGSVVFSTEGSVDHYFHEALVLIIEHSERSGSRGVVLNNPTPWTVQDMTGRPSLGKLDDNPIFLGGDAGRDTMLMVHGLHLVEGATPLGEPGVGIALGGDALYVGGTANAAELVDAGELQASNFRFFYKSVEWLPGQLEKQVAGGMLHHVKLSPSLLLGQKTVGKDLWGRVKTLLKLDGDERDPSGDGRGMAAEAAPEPAWKANAARKDAEAAAAESAVSEEERVAANAQQDVALREGVNRARASVGLGPSWQEEAAAANATSPGSP